MTSKKTNVDKVEWVMLLGSAPIRPGVSCTATDAPCKDQYSAQPHTQVATHRAQARDTTHASPTLVAIRYSWGGADKARGGEGNFKTVVTSAPGLRLLAVGSTFTSSARAMGVYRSMLRRTYPSPQPPTACTCTQSPLTWKHIGLHSVQVTKSPPLFSTALARLVSRRNRLQEGDGYRVSTLEFTEPQRWQASRRHHTV